MQEEEKHKKEEMKFQKFLADLLYESALKTDGENRRLAGAAAFLAREYYLYVEDVEGIKKVLNFSGNAGKNIRGQ